MSDGRRYRDYLPPGWTPAKPATEQAPSVESVVVMKTADGSWEAVWGADSLLGEFQGTREDAIAWALQHCTNCLGLLGGIARRRPLQPLTAISDHAKLVGLLK